MKTKLSGILTLLMALIVHISFAQEKTISGTVTDADGLPLPGVNVLVEGTSNGTQSDFDGKYTINASTGQTLLFTYIGQKNVRKAVGAGNTIDVQMVEDAQALEEVVVTALGFEKKKDDDISSSTIIKTDKISRSGEPNLVQGLAGKTSGVNITQNSGDPGAGAYIQIRGQNTILGNSSPLIIVDGVPVSNSAFGAGTAGVVQQSRLNDIPASDIESVTVLKGAAAAAVWGTGAANGVVVIKTKKGSGIGKMSIDVTSSLSVDEVNREHEKQGIYGQGAGGSWSSNANGLSWGDKIADRTGGSDVFDTSGAYFVGNQTGNTYYPVTTKNSQEVFNAVNRDQIFRTGVTQNYSAGISFAESNSNTYLGLARVDQKGIINGQSDYERNTVRLNHFRMMSDKFSIRFNTSYAHSNSNRIQTGSNLNGLYLGYLRTSPDFDNTDYEGTYFASANDPVGASNSHRSYRARHLGEASAIYNNPGWTINNISNPNTVNRFTLAPELNYNFNESLGLTVRYGLDFYLDKRNTYFPVNSAGDFSQGAYFRDDYSEKIENLNIFFNGNFELSETSNINWILGYMLESTRYSRFSSSTNIFLNPDPVRQLMSNATNENILASEFNSLNRKNGAYYSFNLGYGGLLFETTGRMERATTVEDLNFFPSVSLGYDLTENLIDSDFLSFAKVRASYGQIGIEPQLYLARDVFFSSTAGAEGWGDYLDGANYGGTVRRGAVRGNPDLTIEKIKEFEVGADFRFLEDRLSLGLTYYDRLTTDAILELELPASTGYSSTYENAAEISNKGVEVDFSYSILRNENWKLDLFGNWTTYKNIVEKLPNVSRYILNGFTSTSSAVVEGEPFGAIYGGRYLRDDNGTIQLDADGFPLIDAEQGVIGDPNPDWRGGLGMSLDHKGFKFSFLFETSQGNDMWGGTNGVLHYFGIHPNTAVESVAEVDLPRYSGGFGGVIPAGTTFRGSVADFGGGPVALEEGWYRTNGGGFGDLDEQFVQDASWTKLREVSLSYSFPEKMLDKTFLKNLEVGIAGRNLLLITDFEGVDPEVNLTGASKGRGLDYFTNPATRSIILNVKLGL
ncbi:SusC/RagA family TonB-linked outer membrane protein [Croceivirga sp. JEA036]|uniref:SusC/RagA family TonB-linked outer membrane protein n=1 Tax=Croceivirga sp. JEA036 TaxID=2721162 RepID=UPI0014395398|nr:SusC/RagA family TonB-linked outer membrane protein [Croceivirga sp. JEA036]NJB37246.1 SusC/RagA family TonB-linked outer membrane protein [Croceivirga sp. JEA036]